MLYHHYLHVMLDRGYTNHKYILHLAYEMALRGQRDLPITGTVRSHSTQTGSC